MNRYSSIKLIIFFLILILGSFLIFTAIRYFMIKDSQIVIEEIEEEEEIISECLYGFCLDSFEIIQGVISRNEFFANILLPHGLSPQKIKEVEDSSKNVFSIRKLQAGKTYTIFKSKDSIGTPLYFVYEINAIDYVLYHLAEPVFVRIMQKEVDTNIRTLSGIITRSLWMDMIDAGASPILINKMSEIYEWDINFFRIQKYDKYRLVYEELTVDGETVGVGNILAAWFEHFGENYYAIPFVQNDRKDYFDDQGRNLRKMFLIAPLKFSRISSGFSHSRLHPVLKVRRAHLAVDYAAPSGTPVQAVGDGIVTFAAYSGGAGNMVKIEHNATYTTAYLHLSRFGKGIRKGARVKQGDIIGYVGSTGLSTGPHLDYRVWKNNVPVNPLTLKMPPVESIADSNMAAFEIVKNALIKKLDSINLPEITQD